MMKSLATLALAAALLTACAGSTDHNDADIDFAQGMIPHHEQAIVMSDQALDTTQDPEVRALAEQIKQAQDPEITTMNGWLDDWDAKADDHGDMGGMEHGSGDGMMSESEMKSLDTASGAKFDELWLTLMTKHHEGAVSMAEEELDEGKDPAAKKLAKQVIDGQTAEITTMKGLLSK